MADGLVLIASTEDLLRTALARPRPPTGGPHLSGRGTFNGARASEVVAQLPTTAADLERVILRFFAGAVGLVEDVGFEATWDPSTRVGSMHGRMGVTAGHLPLEVTDVLALVSLGQLEIETIEVVK